MTLSTILALALVGLLAFMVVDYGLARARVSEPLRTAVAVIFAVLVVILVGAL
jgi:hypothetical protein